MAIKSIVLKVIKAIYAKTIKKEKQKNLTAKQIRI